MKNFRINFISHCCFMFYSNFCMFFMSLKLRILIWCRKWNYWCFKYYSSLSIQNGFSRKVFHLFKNVTNAFHSLLHVSPQPPDCYTAPQECFWEGWKGIQLYKGSPISLLMKFMREQKKGKTKIFQMNTNTHKIKTWLKEFYSASSSVSEA